MKWLLCWIGFHDWEVIFHHCEHGACTGAHGDFYCFGPHKGSFCVCRRCNKERNQLAHGWQEALEKELSQEPRPLDEYYGVTWADARRFLTIPGGAGSVERYLFPTKYSFPKKQEKR